MNRGESIISTQWIVDCVAKGRRLPFSDQSVTVLCSEPKLTASSRYYTFKADEEIDSPVRPKKALPKTVKQEKKSKKEEIDEDMDCKPSTSKSKGKYREVVKADSEAEDDEKDESQTESETEDEKTADEDPDSHDDEPAQARVSTSVFSQA